jgi:anti-sigma factor RsiW
MCKQCLLATTRLLRSYCRSASWAAWLSPRNHPRLAAGREGVKLVEAAAEAYAAVARAPVDNPVDDDRTGIDRLARGIAL